MSREVFISAGRFEELLNNTKTPVRCFGLKYPAGTALKRLDPMAFLHRVADFPPTYVCDECGEHHKAEAEADACCK